MSRNRPNPRISITKLAEYMVATPSRRRSILRDQRYPPAFKAAKFRAAYAAIAEVLVRGGDPRLIDEQIAIWRQQVPTTEFKLECLALCVDALTAFKSLVLKGAFRKLSFTRGIVEAYVEFGGVDLSVRPEVLIAGSDVGAVKIYLSKTAPFTKDEKGKPGSSSYAATALHLWAETEFGSAASERCLVVDAFAGEVYAAPARNATRREHLEAACEEIAAMWGAHQEAARGATGQAERGGCAMIPEMLSGWTLDVLRDLLARAVFEDRRLEFKEMLPNGRDRNGQRRLRGTVAAFTNTEGGFLVIGVRDDRELTAEGRTC